MICKKVINTISGILLNGGKFDLLLNTVEGFPDEKHWHYFEHIFSFCQNIQSIFDGLVTALEERSRDFFNDKDAETAKSLLNAILSIKFMSNLADLKGLIVPFSLC